MRVSRRGIERVKMAWKGHLAEIRAKLSVSERLGLWSGKCGKAPPPSRV